MTPEDLVRDPFSSYKRMSSVRTICLPPRYLGNIAQGIRDQLDSEINLFCSDLESVVISYDKLKLLQSVGSILDDSPFLHFKIQADYIVFKPTIGSILKGVVNKVSKDHVGCLVHSRFNASIHRPRQNLNGWRGYQLQQGEEFPFEVLDIYSNNAVISLKGKLVDQKIIEAYLKSLSSKRSSKQQGRDPSGDVSLEHDGGEKTLDKEPAMNKKKRKSSTSEHIGEVIDQIGGNEPALKKNRNDLEISHIESDNLTPIAGKKRKHSTGSSLLDESVLSHKSGLSSTKKVKFDSFVKESSPDSLKKKKKRKMLTETSVFDDSSSCIDSSIADSLILDESMPGETERKKKKKKKKHKKDSIDFGTVEVDVTRLKDKVDVSNRDASAEKDSKIETPSDSGDGSDDQKHMLSGLAEGFGKIFTQMQSDLKTGKRKNKKKTQRDLMDVMVALQNEVTKAANKLGSPVPSSSKKKKQKKKKHRDNSPSPERIMSGEKYKVKSDSNWKCGSFLSDDFDIVSRLPNKSSSEDEMNGTTNSERGDVSFADLSLRKTDHKVTESEVTKEVNGKRKKKKKLKKEKE